MDMKFLQTILGHMNPLNTLSSYMGARHRRRETGVCEGGSGWREGTNWMRVLRLR